MKTLERIMIKLIVIQLIFLLVGQTIQKLDIFPGLQQLSQYEGVTESNFTKILETINQYIK